MESDWLDADAMRQFLAEAFSDEELTAFALDYFRNVYDDFAPGMLVGQKIQLLIYRCEQSHTLPNLLAALQRARPGRYGEGLPQAPPAPPERQSNQVFISHAHADAYFAHRLANDLKQGGWRPWIAPDSIAPGDKWAEAIERGLAESRMFVIVSTPATLRSKWVNYEASAAMELTSRDQMHFVPLNLKADATQYPWSAYQWISFAGDYAGSLQKLLDNLEASKQPPFAKTMLAKPRPASLAEITLPERGSYYPSPIDWVDEVFYALLVDRFSDGQEDTRPLLDRSNLAGAQPEPWRWDDWAESGIRWQGGTLRGVRSKLPYLRQLGVTALRLSPVFKQRGHQDHYHGYAAQDFLDVDPHLGTRRDLADLISEAHGHGMRVILDITFNHSGPNWEYPPGLLGGQLKPLYTPGRYPFGDWLGEDDQAIGAIQGSEDGVWPAELQDPECYMRAGTGDLGAGSRDDANAEFRRSDFDTLRKFNLARALPHLVACYKYWIALVDCDGFYVDVLVHVTPGEARFFCESIKEYTEALGKRDFFLLGELIASDLQSDRYARLLDLGLNAAVDSGQLRSLLTGIATGMARPGDYFSALGAQLDLRSRHVSELDDMDNVFGLKTRFASGPAARLDTVALALQMFTQGIPSIYYGTEQALGSPYAASARGWLPDAGMSDRYMREAMFGPEHPRRSGREGLRPGPAGLDSSLPGFGPFGTAGQHCFDEQNPTYMCIAQLARARQARSPLRSGRQYLRQINPSPGTDGPFREPEAGELLAWSRILAGEEVLCVANPSLYTPRSTQIVVDYTLNPAGSAMTVILNTAPDSAGSPHRLGASLDVQHLPGGPACVEVRGLPPGQVLLLTNKTPTQ